mmetsp:Transcript_35759/g.85638  ORF Transcript_35759/g.85638 Transcript_35759/m.85638 type:complete len:308 (-) Transcript_35759:131-1054(-)
MAGHVQSALDPRNVLAHNLLGSLKDSGEWPAPPQGCANLRGLPGCKSRILCFRPEGFALPVQRLRRYRMRLEEPFEVRFLPVQEPKHHFLIAAFVVMKPQHHFFQQLSPLIHRVILALGSVKVQLNLLSDGPELLVTGFCRGFEACKGAEAMLRPAAAPVTRRSLHELRFHNIRDWSSEFLTCLGRLLWRRLCLSLYLRRPVRLPCRYTGRTRRTGSNSSHLLFQDGDRILQIPEALLQTAVKSLLDFGHKLFFRGKVWHLHTEIAEVAAEGLQGRLLRGVLLCEICLGLLQRLQLITHTLLHVAKL